MADAPTQPRIPYLAAFKREDQLILTPVANGGWVVRSRGNPGPGYEADELGAFTDTRDMLTALNNALAANG